MDRAPQEKKRLQLIKIPVNISFFFAFFFFPNVKMTDSYSTCCSHSRNSPVLLVPQLVQPLHFELFTSTEINTSQPAPLATMIWECRRKCGPNCLLDEPILAARGRSLQGNTSPPQKKKPTQLSLPQARGPPVSWSIPAATGPLLIHWAREQSQGQVWKENQNSAKRSRTHWSMGLETVHRKF